MTMTVADAGDIGNQSNYTPPVTEFQDLPLFGGADLVGRRRAVGNADGAGLSIGHISPLSSENLRIVNNEIWNDTPTVAQFRNSAGSLVAGEGRSGSVEWSPDGSFLKVSKPSLHAVKSSIPSTSKRAAVSGFSRRSRSRLLQLLSKVKRVFLPFFITLTYPGKPELVPWDNPEQWKRDLIDKFCKRLVRRFPQVSAVWKLEPQKRGAPHFHLLLWLQVPAMNQDAVLLLLRSWVRLAWWECVGQGDSDHFKAGTSVERVRSWNGVCFYASKYMGKAVSVDNEAWGRPGRWWGVINRACLPMAVVMVATLYYNEACDLIRWIRRFKRANFKRKIKGRDSPSAWLVVADPDAWVTNFDRFTRGV